MYNVLVCDDEKDIVSALQIYLKSEGYQVFSAYNGKEALKIINREDIQLVLMDIMMPEMDGIEAMCKIREISNVPVILLTAKSEDTDKVLGLTVGGNGQGDGPDDGRGRLCDETIQSSGTAGESEIPDPAVYAAWKRTEGEDKTVRRRHRAG